MANNVQDRPLAALLTDLTREMADLTRQEVQLAKVEIAEKAQEMIRGYAMLAVGALVGFAALLVLLAAISLWLGDVAGWNATRPWLAPLIVSVVVALIAFSLWQYGRSHARPAHLVPHRAMESMRRDKQVIREHAA